MGGRYIVVFLSSGVGGKGAHRAADVLSASEAFFLGRCTAKYVTMPGRNLFLVADWPRNNLSP